MDVTAVEQPQAGLNAALQTELEVWRAAGLYRSFRTVAGAQDRLVVLDGRECLNFASNDYLGLANHPALKTAAREALERYGVGAGASRLICGNQTPHAELERALAEFKQREAALVFASGYAANVGTISALVGPGDIVLLDKLCHASLIDGARQSGATLRVFPHGHMARLKRLLEQPRNARRVLILTESVFSMDGDRAALAELVELKERYEAWLLVDEAHATGVFGSHGRGLAEQDNVENRIEVTIGTLSKALGCLGGFATGSRPLIEYLRNKARSLVYSTALPAAVCAAATAAVRLLSADEGRQRRERLWANVRTLDGLLAEGGGRTATASPIVPVVVGADSAAVEASQRLLEEGIFVPAIRYPTVPPGKARLRISVTAAHTAGDLQRLARALVSLTSPR